MAAFLDTGGTMSCVRWRVWSETIASSATAATALGQSLRDVVYECLREPIRLAVHEILYPRNWRWFHAFARPVETVRAMADEPRRETQRRAQERFPAAEARARKRRAWLASLRA